MIFKNTRLFCNITYLSYLRLDLKVINSKRNSALFILKMFDNLKNVIVQFAIWHKLLYNSSFTFTMFTKYCCKFLKHPSA